MTKVVRNNSTADDLVTRYGPLMSGEDLWRTLGFKSSAAFRQAKAKKRLNILVFSLPNRRGIFAFTKDVAKWLTELEQEVKM